MKDTLLLPETLLSDKGISPLAKYLYVVTQIGQPVSVAALSKLSGISRPTVSRLCKQLAKQGWIYNVRKGSISTPVPAIPNAVQEQMSTELYAGLSAAPLKGEYLLRKWLEYLILSTDYIDNARPSFLQNPVTGERLEYDRFYPCGVAFEYMGAQHYGPTEAFPDVAQFRETRVRDVIKRGLSEENGITLVYITSDDLTLQAMLKKIPEGLPRRQVDPKGPYVKALEQASAEYRASLAKAMTRERSSERGGQKGNDRPGK